MKRLHNIIAGAAALVLALTLCVTAFGDSLSYGDMSASIVSAEKAQLGIAAAAALLTGENFPAGSSVSDWTALAMARAGIADDYAGYLARLQAYVERQYAENGGPPGFVPKADGGKPSRGKLCVRLDSPCHGPRRCCRRLRRLPVPPAILCGAEVCGERRPA